jgi:hypothetical protein
LKAKACFAAESEVQPAEMGAMYGSTSRENASLGYFVCVDFEILSVPWNQKLGIKGISFKFRLMEFLLFTIAKPLRQ